MLERYAVIAALKTVLSSPQVSFSVRGLARAAGLSPGAAQTALKYMQQTELVSLKIVGKTFQFKANLDSALCRHWKIVFNLEQITDSRIVQECVKKIPALQSVLLYGSFARGTNDEKSDIDLLFITHHPVKINLGFVNRLKKEANITVFSLNEWRKNALENKVFYENIILDSIALVGEKPVVI